MTHRSNSKLPFRELFHVGDSAARHSRRCSSSKWAWVSASRTPARRRASNVSRVMSLGTRSACRREKVKGCPSTLGTPGLMLWRAARSATNRRTDECREWRCAVIVRVARTTTPPEVVSATYLIQAENSGSRSIRRTAACVRHVRTARPRTRKRHRDSPLRPGPNTQRTGPGAPVAY
jgi:hypothetical protein